MHTLNNTADRFIEAALAKVAEDSEKEAIKSCEGVPYITDYTTIVERTSYKQLTNITNVSPGKCKFDNSHSSPDRCSTSASWGGDSLLSKVKSGSPTSEEIRRNSLIDRKTKRRSKHGEK